MSQKAGSKKKALGNDILSKLLGANIYSKSRLHKLLPRLPHRHIIQKHRSLEIHGISDSILKALIEDYQEFTKDNYGIIFDSTRIVSLIEAIIYSNKIPGDFAECGVYHGSSSKILRWFGDSEKVLHCFDTFTGFTIEDRETETIKGIKRDPGVGHINTSLAFAKERIFSPVDNIECPVKSSRVLFHVGPVQNTLNEVSNVKFALVHLDMDLYAPTKFALEFFIPRISDYGLLILNDHTVDRAGYRGVAEAIDELTNPPLLGPLPFGDQSTTLYVKRPSSPYSAQLN